MNYLEKAKAWLDLQRETFSERDNRLMKRSVDNHM